MNSILVHFQQKNRYYISLFSGHSIVEEYDFIIVGAGSAGSALANRLSEVRDWKILLLEAGVEGDFLTDIPEFAVVQQFYWHNWGYVTEREENLYSGRAF